MKIKEVHIGSPKNPKFANVRDYWDDEVVAKIADLLHEYQNLFHTNFSKMRGIMRYLGEMKIPLRLDAKPSSDKRHGMINISGLSYSKKEDLSYCMITNFSSS